MQKVERKGGGTGRGGRRGLTAALAFCLMAGGVTAGILMSREGAEAPAAEAQERGGVLTALQPEELERITITEGEEGSWTLERGADGEWMLEGETEGNVDPRMSGRITDALAGLEYTDVYSEKPEEYRERLAAFGLEQPRIAAEWTTTTGETYALRIGDAVPGHSGSSFMLMEGDDRLFGVDAGTVQDLSIDRELLHEVPELPVMKALLDRITVRDGEGNITAEWALEGRLTDSDAGVNWRITQPFVYAADEETMDALRENAANLTLGAWIGRANEENLEAAGLKTPRGEIEFHMGAGSTGTVTEDGVYDVRDWEESSVRLIIGAGRNELTDYVQYGQEIYTMTHFSLQVFTEAKPMEMAARYIALTPLDSLVSLTVETAAGDRTSYEILRESGEEEGQKTRCLKNGEEVSWEAFEAAYQRLMTVTVSGRLPEGARWGKTEKKYTFRAVDGGTHVVELGEYDGMHDAVTLDGETVFYLIKGGVTELP